MQSHFAHNTGSAVHPAVGGLSGLVVRSTVVSLNLLGLLGSIIILLGCGLRGALR
jgi:hypothetical protein